MAATANSDAICVDNDSEFLVRHDLPVPQALEGEIKVAVTFSGANPADLKHTTELSVTDTVLGYDFCGTVIASCSRDFIAGDVVAGYTPTGLNRAYKYGTHQSVLVCPADMAFRVPTSGMLQSHAAALTTVAATAADALFNLCGLQLPTESRKDQGSASHRILVWGASSSVGICAVQFARASAGVQEVLAVASSAHHSLLKSLGATACFDYHDMDVLDQIRSYMSGKGELSACIDAVGARDTADLLLACCEGQPDVKLISVVFRPGQEFQTPFGMQNREIRFSLVASGGREVVLPANAEAHWRAWKAVKWAVDNYGQRFELPKVDEFCGSAEEWLQTLEVVAAGKRGLGKVVWRRGSMGSSS